MSSPIAHVEPFTVSDGVALRLLRFGPSTDRESPAPFIVFVPGVLSPVASWQAVIDVLATRFPVLYVETRDKAGATLPRRTVDFSMSRFRTDLHEVIEAKVPPGTPLSLVGSSLGSTTILEYLASRARTPVVSVVVAPNATLRVPGWLLPLARMAPVSLWQSTVRPVVRWYFSAYLVDRSEPEQTAKYRQYIDAAEPGRLRRMAVALHPYELWESLPGVASRVIVVAGRTDRLHSLADTERIVRNLPNARLHLMESNRETHSERAAELIVREIDLASGSR
jgi:pimeloyl-ACP methyl ester carboxylesterase